MEILINQNNKNKRLDTFFPDFSRSKITKAITEGLILVNNKNQKPSYKLKENDIIYYDEKKLDCFLNPSMELLPYEFKLDIKYEDEDLIIINKPKEILTHPTKYERLKTISNALIYHCGRENLSGISGSDRPGIVHRLDKNTSGLMIAVKNNEAHQKIALQIKNKTLKRKYLAIALGEFKEKKGTIDKPLVHYLKDDVKMAISDKGLEAITNYKVIEEFKGASIVELELKTGRTHQIRAHLASINHPVFGDSLYGAKSFMRNEFYNLKTTEQLLQSYFISFIHPRTGENMEFQLHEEEYSKDFIKVLNFLRRINAND
ncbi:MAG: RluA family pseudouridine synthase [Candidatus Gastranaerophilales bacterium]|nr:RluA family pseudouridine synthase [Candidatus Gastranaerophilales bacterium]